MILTEETSTIIDIWRSSPSIACNDLLHLPLSPSQDDNYILIPPQRIVADRIWRAKSSIVVACRGFGKTRMAATLAILQAWLYPGRRIGCLSASFRQAKQIFDEIDKIWSRSPLLQQSTIRNPIISNDACRLQFKAVAGYDPSVIIALPLADGSKIRGARFHSIYCDEAVHIPEDVFNLVIRPMAATHQNPVQAMRIEREKDVIKGMGLPAELEQQRIKELEEFVGANQICMLTSGYYSFNYVFDLYTKYLKRMNNIFEKNPDELAAVWEDDDYGEDNPLDYAAFQVPWQAIPKGFLDKKGLKQAMRDMDRLKFRMEYEAAWITDTGGFFKASDIEACRATTLGITDHFVISRGESGKVYVLAIDPARKNDAFAMVIFEFDPKFGAKVVHAEQHTGSEAYLPKMVTRIFELSNLFNFIRIGIDRFGGGQQVADLLAQAPLDGTLPLYDIEDERYKGLKGRHIVKLQEPSSSWIEDAHHNVYNMLQKRQMSFPRKRLDSSEGEYDNEVHKTIELMVSQILSITLSETRTGRLHFDLPETGGGFQQHKDLYSAFIIGGDICYQLLQKEMIPQHRMPLLGLVTPRFRRYLGL